MHNLINESHCNYWFYNSVSLQDTLFDRLIRNYLLTKKRHCAIYDGYTVKLIDIKSKKKYKLVVVQQGSKKMHILSYLEYGSMRPDGNGPSIIRMSLQRNVNKLHCVNNKLLYETLK